MCGRCQFAAERCAEIRQIIDLIQWKYGAEQWLSDSSQTEVSLSTVSPALAVQTAEQQMSLW